DNRWLIERHRAASLLCKRAKGYRPLLRFSGPEGRPHSCLFASPNRGGWRADKAHFPDYSGWGVRIAPDDEVHLRCTPRLAARQRGILAFMPLTVVGPGRLLVAEEAARVRPGDEGCVSPSLAGAPPVPRLQNASGRRPSKLGSGWRQHSCALGE